MTCQSARDLLARRPDAVLAPGERTALDGHLAACAECRALADDAAALRPWLGPLRAGVTPPDVLPAVRRAVRARARRRTAAWLVAAAVLLVTGSSLATAWLLDRRAADAMVAERPAAELRPGLAVARREADYARAIGELAAVLDRARPNLSPATVAILERNLAIIDRAIAESRAALRADPGNRDLASLLWATYEQKMELLRQAQRLATPS